jgi:hypothetical protein
MQRLAQSARGLCPAVKNKMKKQDNGLDKGKRRCPMRRVNSAGLRTLPGIG